MSLVRSKFVEQRNNCLKIKKIKIKHNAWFYAMDTAKVDTAGFFETLRKQCTEVQDDHSVFLQALDLETY